jgi:hypothetical protein
MTKTPRRLITRNGGPFQQKDELPIKLFLPSKEGAPPL